MLKAIASAKYLFTKPYIVNMSSHSKTSLFVWVPIIVYLKRRKDYENDLLSALSRNDRPGAFKCAFMLNSPPTDAQSLLCPEWKDYYGSRIASLKCCSCKA